MILELRYEWCNKIFCPAKPERGGCVRSKEYG